MLGIFRSRGVNYFRCWSTLSHTYSTGIFLKVPKVESQKQKNQTSLQNSSSQKENKGKIIGGHNVRQEFIDCCRKQETVGAKLLEELQKYLGTYHLKQLKSIVFYASQTRVQDKGFYLQLVESLESKMGQLAQLDDASLVLISYGLGKGITEVPGLEDLHPRAQQIVEGILKSLGQRISHLEPINLTHVSFAMRKLNLTDTGAIQLIVESFVKNLEKFKDQDISQTIFNLGKLKAHSEKNSSSETNSVLDSIFASNLRQNVSFQLQLLDKIRNQMSNNNNLQALVNTSWGLSRLGVDNPDIWGIFCQVFLQKRRLLNDQNFRIAVSSVSSTQRGTQQFYDQMREDFVERLNRLSTEDFTRLFRSFTAMKNNIIFENFDTLKEDAYVEENLRRFSLDDLIQILSSYSQNGTLSPLTEKIIERIGEVRSNLDFFQCLIVNWYLRILDCFNAVLLEQFVQELDAKSDLQGINLKYTIQLYQILQSLSLEQPEFYEKSGLSKYQEPSRKQLLEQTLIPRRQKILGESEPTAMLEDRIFELSSTLDLLNLRHTKEIIVEDYSIDFAILNLRLTINPQTQEETLVQMPDDENLNSQLSLDRIHRESCVLVEINGNSHFFSSKRSARGSTLFKLRILNKNSWKVLSISSQMCKEISLLPHQDRAQTILKLVLQTFKNQITK